MATFGVIAAFGRLHRVMKKYKKVDSSFVKRTIQEWYARRKKELLKSSAQMSEGLGEIIDTILVEVAETLAAEIKREPTSSLYMLELELAIDPTEYSYIDTNFLKNELLMIIKELTHRTAAIELNIEKNAQLCLMHKWPRLKVFLEYYF